MGPRPFSRGYTLGSVHIYPAFYGLQWGHGLSAVDTCKLNMTLSDSESLQWGHGLSAVDTRYVEIG